MRPDIAYATHKCARFCEDPKEEHAQAVENLVKYFSGTKDKGIIISPREDPEIDIFADADFFGNWNRATANNDVGTAKSRTGYVINFASCPIIWISKIQTHIALSTTEADDGISLMQLILEMRERKLIDISSETRVLCRSFEDNSGELEIANVPKLRPCTKQINIIYHHFRSYVKKGLVKIYAIKTSEQLGDILTKPLAQNQFQYLRRKIMMW